MIRFGSGEEGKKFSRRKKAKNKLQNMEKILKNSSRAASAKCLGREKALLRLSPSPPPPKDGEHFNFLEGGMCLPATSQALTK
jgi:hypothetical protein